MKMKRISISLVFVSIAVVLLIAGCAPAATAPTPTKAAAAPTKAAEPAKTSAEPTKAAAQPSAQAKKAEWPTKGQPIILTVPFAAGGASDIAARLLAPLMEKELQVPVEVANKAGAATQVASAELAKAKPDGYNLGIVSIPTIMTTYLDPERKATYSRKDFQPVALYTSEPITIAVKSDSPYKTLNDLVNAAKANPGKIGIATPGLMGSPHLGALALQRAAGVDFAYVHFDAGGQAVTALLGGHVDAVSASASNFLSNFKAGTVRPLGVMDTEESKFYPGVKTMEAQGFKVVVIATYGIAAPAGTPKEVVDVLNSTIKKAMETDELKSKIDTAGLALSYMDSTQYGNYWSEMDDWAKPLIELAKQK